MNPINSAVRKIHNLLSSGAVTVTGPNQPRILKQKVGSTVVSTSATNNMQQSSGNMVSGRCYICDENTTGTQNQALTEMQTTHTSTKFPNKIGQLVGDAFMVIVSVEDVVCQRCTNLINYLDRLENDVERVRNNILNLLHKKYGLNDDGNNAATSLQTNAASSPPIKMQKLSSGNTTVSRVTTMNDDGSSDPNRTRKTASNVALSDTMGKQSPPVSAVQQIKISTPVQQQQLQQPKKTGTKVYKCLSCDFKTTDLKQFNPHYETCKQQNFQCKICKKIFANLAAMKQHMAKDHGTSVQSTTGSGATEHTCNICHLNFTSDLALKKHTELNHSNSLMGNVQSSAIETPPSQHSTPLYTCNHCQFKSTDKPLFDEHMRKHIGSKPKPFKCRLCSMRFETREQATIHAKQHQPNYFKCATCSMSFPKRELLVKHFEIHQQQQAQKQPVTTVQQQVQIVQQQPQQQSNSPQIMTTQKLLQDTIDEALSESAGEGDSTKSIRFFSCHICSLTFIQENYYNQHMETHKREKKSSSMSASSAGAAVSTTVTQVLTSTAQSTMSTHNQSLIRDVGKQRHEAANILISASNVQHSNNTRGTSSVNTNTGAAISDADIESIFEKMHSDKSESESGTVVTSASGNRTSDSSVVTATAGTNNSNDNLVITSQESSSGGITFNITIPQPDGSEQHNGEGKSNIDRGDGTPVSVSIDMPVLDQGDDSTASSKKNTVASSSTSNHNNAGDNSKKDDSNNRSAAPVSMPSLDDDNEAAEEQQQSTGAQQQSQEKIKHESQESQQSAPGGDLIQNSGEDTQQDQNDQDDNSQQQLGAAGDHVSMDLDDMQAGVEGGQIKFILNENGQLLQLDNHIITDADGNQILVQGSDSEQIQQLLQSVGVLQSGDGLDGETLQMIGDNNGQMVLVQGEQGETQLIDASLLNADGHIVIQQSHDGDLSEGGAHVIGEDGTRIPVSVSYTADGQPIVQVQQQHQPSSDEGVEAADKENVSLDEVHPTTTGETTGVTVSQSLAQSSGGGYFALEDLMQQSDATSKSTE